MANVSVGGFTTALQVSGRPAGQWAVGVVSIATGDTIELPFPATADVVLQLHADGGQALTVTSRGTVSTPNRVTVTFAGGGNATVNVTAFNPTRSAL